MKLYVVIGIWWYEETVIKGIYSTEEKAIKRKVILDADKFSFDETKIREYTVDVDIDDDEI